MPKKIKKNSGSDEAEQNLRRINPIKMLPYAINRKIYKTCQTRGADNDEIFQNRVKRDGTVLIRFSSYKAGQIKNLEKFLNGYIVLIRPEDYFSLELHEAFPELKLGENMLVFYERRSDWDKWNPDVMLWTCASSRTGDLGGQYVARIPDTTSEEDDLINRGFTTSDSKGAGIRVFEYANESTIYKTQLQLSWLAWQTEDIYAKAIDEEFTRLRKSKVKSLAKLNQKEIQAKAVENVVQARTATALECKRLDLIDMSRLEALRLVSGGIPICPLCRKKITALDLASRLTQAEGRETDDITVTAANLFHIKELRVGEFNHEIYNLGWGHHYCNTVIADYGIPKTLEWMKDVLTANNCL